MTVTASFCSFSKKRNNPIMPLDQNPHQIGTRFGCVGFSMYSCGISVPQMRQKSAPNSDSCPKCDNFACLHICQDQNELHLKRWFFFAKIGIKPVCKPYTQPYSFGRRIKLIIYQISHKLSVTIHVISTSWKKQLNGGPNISIDHLNDVCYGNESVIEIIV